MKSMATPDPLTSEPPFALVRLTGVVDSSTFSRFPLNILPERLCIAYRASSGVAKC